MNFKRLLGLACAATLLFAVPTFAAAQIDILQIGAAEPSRTVCALPTDLVAIPATDIAYETACVIADAGISYACPIASKVSVLAMRATIPDLLPTCTLTRPSPPG